MSRSPPIGDHLGGQLTPGDGWPLVGRDREMAALADVLAQWGAVVVAGDAGVGKSRLAREVVTAASHDRVRDRAPIVTATRSAREIPLGALAPWLPVALDRTPDGGSVRWAADALAARGADAVLGIDDAHHLDPVSATVLHHLASQRAVRLVLTMRVGEAVPDAVTTLWKDELARRWELGPLDEPSTGALVEAVLGGPVDPGAARRLFATTHGNALWLRHLLDGEREAGRLSLVSGTWRWTGRATPTPALEQLVSERIGVLSTPQREALELLSLGEPLGLAQLAGLVDAVVVEELADRGLVRIATDGARRELWLGHPLYGEVVRSVMNPLRARRLRSSLSEVLAVQGSRRAGDGLRRAVLDLDSDRKPDPELLTEAAVRSVALGDVHLAERLFRAARDAGGGFEPQLGLGSMLMWRLSAVEEAEEELARAADEAGTAAERARALRARVQNAYLGRAHTVQALEMLEAELASGPGPPHADLLATRAMLDGLAGRCVAADPEARAVLASTEATPVARTLAGWVLVATRALRGHGDPPEELAAEAVRAARTAPECAPLRAAIGFWEVTGLGVQGRLAVARDRVGEMRDGQGEYTALFATMSEARIALDGGQVRTAQALVDRIAPSFPGFSSGWSSQIGLMSTAAAAMAGDAVTAAAQLTRTRAIVHPGVSLIATQLDLAQAWVSAARGAADDAVNTARRVAAAAAGAAQHGMEMIARHTAVCFGDRRQSAPLRRLTAMVDGPRVAAAAAHAEAWATRDPAGLLGAATDLEQLDLLLFAADAAAQAAVLHRDAGRLGPATVAADRARQLAVRCEGASTPALRAASGTTALSDREREIATLAAEGLTNREVAARLGVSIRTVESHVYHARTRLGLADRAQLIALVAPAGR